MKIDEIVKELSEMPHESLVYKTIKGKRQPYLQWTEYGKTRSRYVKCAERERILHLFARKEELKKLYREALERIEWSSEYESSEGVVAERNSYAYSKQEQLISPKREHGTFSVEREYINSMRFHDKFMSLPVNNDVRECLYRETGRLLEFVDGKDEERMSVVSARTGEHIVDNFGRPGQANHTSYVQSEYDKIKAYPGFVIVIHNHPSNGRPSAKDILSYAADEHIKMSLIACHDGTLYALYSAKPNVKDVFEELLSIERERFQDLETAKCFATTRLYLLNDRLGERHKLFDLRRF